MDEEKLRAIASEPQELRDKRASLKEKLSVLEAGKTVLSEYMSKCLFNAHIYLLGQRS